MVNAPALPSELCDSSTQKIIKEENQPFPDLCYEDSADLDMNFNWDGNRYSPMNHPRYSPVDRIYTDNMEWSTGYNYVPIKHEPVSNNEYLAHFWGEGRQVGNQRSHEVVWNTVQAEQTSLWGSAVRETYNEELRDLKDAYQAMSKLSADYIKQEKEMNKNNENNRQISKSSYPVMKVNETEHRALKSKVHSMSVFRDGISLCREWLDQHYEYSKDMNMLRSAMYHNYVNYCRENSMEPVNQATFGKAVRSSFPAVSTRRLGMRGHSKYHYHGLSVKATSPYHTVLVSAQRRDSRAVSTKPRPRLIPLASKIDHVNLLQGFPNHISVGLQRDLKLQLSILLRKYRDYCVAILEIIRVSQYNTVGTSMINFWRNLNESLRSLLRNHAVADLIRLCDSVLYNGIAELLLPYLTETLSEERVAGIRNFSHNIVTWTKLCLIGYDSYILEAKLQAAETFVKMMERQTALVQLCGFVRPSLNCRKDLQQMAIDWNDLDYQVIAEDIAQELGCPDDDVTLSYVKNYLNDFEGLLNQDGQLDKLLQFAEKILTTCSSPSDANLNEDVNGVRTRYARFLLRWNQALHVLSRELALNNAISLGRLHVLGEVLTEYMLHLVEDGERAAEEKTLRCQLLSGEAQVEISDHVDTTNESLQAETQAEPRITQTNQPDFNNNESCESFISTDSVDFNSQIKIKQEPEPTWNPSFSKDSSCDQFTNLKLANPARNLNIKTESWFDNEEPSSEEFGVASSKPTLMETEWTSDFEEGTLGRLVEQVTDCDMASDEALPTESINSEIKPNYGLRLPSEALPTPSIKSEIKANFDLNENNNSYEVNDFDISIISSKIRHRTSSFPTIKQDKLEEAYYVNAISNSNTIAGTFTSVANLSAPNITVTPTSASFTSSKPLRLVYQISDASKSIIDHVLKFEKLRETLINQEGRRVINGNVFPVSRVLSSTTNTTNSARVQPKLATILPKPGPRIIVPCSTTSSLLKSLPLTTTGKNAYSILRPATVTIKDTQMKAPEIISSVTRM